MILAIPIKGKTETFTKQEATELRDGITRLLIGDGISDGLHVILGEVCKEWDVSLDQIGARGRPERLVEPRQAFYYLSRKFTDHTWQEIANVFAHLGEKSKHHSTAHYGCEAMAEKLTVRPELALRVAAIEERLKANGKETKD